MENETMRRLAAVLSLLLAFASTAAGQTVWTMPTEYPANTMPGEGVSFFAEAIAKRAGNELSILPVFAAKGELVSARMPKAVGDGVVQAADAFGGALGAAQPVFSLSSLPFLTASTEDARRLLVESRGLYEASLANQGLKLLYTTPWPPSGLWTKEAVESAVALKDLPVRTYDAISSRVFAAAGAQAANLTFADVMPRLKDNSITAVLSSGDGGAGRRLWEYLPHFTTINYAFPLSFAFVSRASYDALSPQAKQAVDEAAKETEERQWATLASRLEANMRQMKENGVVLHSPAAADLIARLKDASGPIIDEWAANAGADSAEALRRYRQR
jgi:TRAP-type C4-dicarboxylate transport system substrate-binding protein